MGQRNNRYRVLNSYVNAISMEETIKEVEKIIQKRIPTQHVVINASKINLMEKDKTLRKIVNDCPLINADGASIVWAAKRLGVPLKERVTGCDLFQNLVGVAAEKGYKIYLFGAKEEVVTKVKDIYEKQYPGIQIVGYRNGYFTEADELEIVQGMRESGADMMFVAFSSPKKEYWVNKYLKELNIPFVMGVGGSFDIVAGVTERAPIWFQNHGLEWFYRFIQEPRRMWKRYIVGNVKFVILTYKYKFRKGRENG
ncbi:MAG: WecB/TagA/CpsF family glycosyltransferase [Lachnospiraceae bacterium]|nr:WecB/TagA/CpsF family glycosyltransferase [Lachnospiraceae bacterium]